MKLRNGASNIIRLNVKKEFQDTFETQMGAMLAKAEKYPGHLCSMIIPPLTENGNYQVIQKFSTQQHLHRWQESKERKRWGKKLQLWSEPSTDTYYLTDTKVIFTPTEMLPRVRGAYKARLATVSWIGIFPTVAVFLWFGSPLLEGLPFLIRIAILTALIVPTMSYVVMPRLIRWMGWWLHKPG